MIYGQENEQSYQKVSRQVKEHQLSSNARREAQRSAGSHVFITKKNSKSI